MQVRTSAHARAIAACIEPGVNSNFLPNSAKFTVNSLSFSFIFSLSFSVIFSFSMSVTVSLLSLTLSSIGRTGLKERGKRVKKGCKEVRRVEQEKNKEGYDMNGSYGMKITMKITQNIQDERRYK